jgi:ABC-type multidrug transport system fused ATPase/permease subunit
MTPKVLAPERRLPFARLGLFSLAEAGAISATAVLVRAVFDGAADATFVAIACALAATGVAAFAFGWLRAVAAEDIGMGYANEVRLLLAAHAAAEGARARLGALAVRMTGDLNPMREWVSLGVSEALAATASIVGACVALAIAAGAAGLSGAITIVFATGVYFAALRPPLVRALRRLRSSRGRVAALAGDIVLGAAAIHRYDVFSRESRRLTRRGEQLRKDAVYRRRLAAALEAPAALAAPLLAIGLAALQAPALGAAMTGDLALILFGAGLLGLGLRSGARAFDAQASFSVAQERLRTLARAVERSETPSPSSDAEPVAGAAADFAMRLPDGETATVERGKVLLVHAPESLEALEYVVSAGQPDSGSRLGRRPLAVLTRRDRARRVALATPAVPLLRGSVRRNLSLRRMGVSDEAMNQALNLVGLARARWTLERRIDPSIREPDEHSQALLRIARAVAHRPRIILVAEPTLYFAPDAPALYRKVAEATGAAIVAASASVEACADAQIRDLRPGSPLPG